MKGEIGNMMGFISDPFYLYAIKDEMIDNLFVNREDELSIAKGILGMKFGDTTEICLIVGGIGVGKSSLLHRIVKIANDMGYNVEFFDSLDSFYSGIEKSRKKKTVSLIDDVGKVSDDEAREFYDHTEKHMSEHGGILFFSDTYHRHKKTLESRNFTVSQSISLPRGMNKEKLSYFLRERMKRCLAPGEKFDFPFEDESLNIAATRSGGNLRNFLNYAKNGWMVAAGSEKTTVGMEEMKTGMIIIDRALLGICDIIDFKILWHSTTGIINKTYLAHKCEIDTKTLDSRIDDKLAELITQKRSGKDVVVTSIYRYIDGGQEILENVMEGLGVHKADVTGGKD
ncbi:MAG: hypothetical protein Q7J68_07225 [Thermoplasmata archaeon]|nr:hypothetical protein [Thermoplasmata archaeon]